MDPASLQKIRSQLDEFKHHLAEFEAAMAQGMAVEFYPTVGWDWSTWN